MKPLTAPFPYFGGKRRAAPIIWDALGDVRDWCLGADPALRIVLCGYSADHDQLLDHGWTKSEGRAGGGAGYSADGKAGRRERLWLSPACVPTQGSLFDGGAA